MYHQFLIIGHCLAFERNKKRMKADDLVETLKVRLRDRKPVRIGGSFRALGCGQAIRVPAAQGKDGEVPERRASVAIVLRRCRGSSDLECLFMKRATNPRDPWSGDVCLPGGKQEAGETDLETAVRETREEVGIDLSAGGFEYLGQLDDRTDGPRNRIVICPFVFVGSEGVNTHLKPCASEVAAAWWCSLDETLRAPLTCRTITTARPFRILKERPALQVRLLCNPLKPR